VLGARPGALASSRRRGQNEDVRHRPTIAGLALLGALLGGIVANVFGDKAHPHPWISILGYAVAALLVLFVALALAGLAALVRRTFEVTHRVRH